MCWVEIGESPGKLARTKMGAVKLVKWGISKNARVERHFEMKSVLTTQPNPNNIHH